MIVCTTIVLFILVETTWPILVLRVPWFAVVVSAIYFFLFLALAAVFFFAVLPFTVLPLAVLPADACFFGCAGAAGSAAAAPSALALGASGAAMPSSFSRITV